MRSIIQALDRLIARYQAELEAAQAMPESAHQEGVALAAETKLNLCADLLRELEGNQPPDDDGSTGPW
jgi:hypothetical protein